MAHETKVRSADELYDYANHLRWAANDLNECYHDVKSHASDFAQQWGDDSSERFMHLLEQQQHVINELTEQFARFESLVRKRAELVQEYVARGKRYSL